MAKSKKQSKTSKPKSEKKLGFFGQIGAYFASVRSEMHRVVWPTKSELVNYSIAVVASLIVVGLAIALLDTVIGEALIFLSGLRG